MSQPPSQSQLSLLQAVRDAALPGIWSAGVNLSRKEAVSLESRSADGSEVVLRVKAAGRPVAQSVVLYPNDEAWECDCPARVDPCEHVVAAAIGWSNAASEKAPLAKVTERGARVVYHFSRVSGGLELKRMLAQPDGTEAPLEESLLSKVAKPAEAAKLSLESFDLHIDRLLERSMRGPIHAERLDGLLRLLEPSRNVLLDGRPVAISGEVVFPRAVVEDRDEAVAVVLERDPRITAVVSAGVALCGEALCRLGELSLTGPGLQNLPVVKRYAPAQWAELSAKLLPELARRFPVEVTSKRIPKLDRELKPRIALELTQVDAGLSVLPTLVYGAPPRVRIDGGNMVFLRGAVPLRDEALEGRLIQSLREQLNLIPGHRSTVTGAELLPFVNRLRAFRGDLTGDGAKWVSPDLRLVPVLRIDGGSVDGNAVPGAFGPQVGFDLQFRVEGGKSADAGSVDAETVVRAWQEGLGLVSLQGTGWAPLPIAWLSQHGQRVLDLLSARDGAGKIANHALLQLGALAESLESPPPPGLERLRPLTAGFETLPEPELPSDLTATLRPYQRRGVSWLQFLRTAGIGGVLADDMGLGKTLQAACVLGRAPGEKALVVCPTSVLPNWEAELRKFRPGLKLSLYRGPGRALDPEADVTLTTYALLRLDAEQLAAQGWSAVVLDEAQAIKNPDSQVARAAFALKAELRLALSGTPVENRLEELWSLMHFANPGLLGGRRDFQENWATPVAEGRPDAAAKLRARIRPFVLRRLKRDVVPELPPRSESVLHVSLDERERTIYETVLAATRTEVLSLLGQGGSVMKALEALLRLRQAACHPALLPGQVAESSSKVQRLVEALGTAASDGHKALVFSQWTGLLDLVEPELKGAGLAFERLDGSTRDRAEVVARFQAEDGPPVILISLKAGGTGLNLTAADHVFLLDPWWNPAVEAQAADRAHRIGQERPVMIYRMVSDGTVEERILKLQESKRALFEAALGEGGGAASLTREDLAALFV